MCGVLIGPKRQNAPGAIGRIAAAGRKVSSMLREKSRS
jgi:hypothetical protein